MPDMLERKGQFDWILKIARVAMIVSIVLLALGGVVAAAATAATAVDAFDTGRWIALAPYALVLIAALIGVIWLFVIEGVVHAIVSNEQAVHRAAGHLGRIETLLEDQGTTLKKLADVEILSDRAKSLIYRDKELEILQEVIHDDMVRQDYQTAERRIETMERDFGYADEAQRLREQLAAERKATLDEKIDWAIDRIHKIMEIHDWPRALRAARKLQNAFPNNPKVGSLPAHVEADRVKHKRQLLQDYGEAVRKDDVDGGIVLLKELDRYLSPQEAAALQESARGVFRAKLHNMGVQFAIRVTDERWDEAVTIGEQIVRNFPNSRMSHEVRQKMPQLHAHAAAATGAG